MADTARQVVAGRPLLLSSMNAHDLAWLVAIGIFSFVTSYVGAAVGLVLGHFRVAMLTYAFGSPAAAVATSLAISTFGSLAGAASHARSGRVRLAPLLLIGAPSAVAAYFSGRYAVMANPRVLKLAIAATLLVAGVRLVCCTTRATASRERDVDLIWTWRTGLGQVLLGAVLGAVSGLVGLLLGSLRLPAMLRLGGVMPLHAVGTNMAIGAITGLSAGVAALSSGRVSAPVIAIVGPLTLLGAHLGARRTGTMDAATVTRWIGAVLVPTALLMLGELLLARS
jgi:uncharacterized membrane protein YfcA